MINDLCVKCDGRGFQWVKAKWRSRPHKIDYYQGPKCLPCNGTGKKPSGLFGCGFWALVILVSGLYLLMVVTTTN